MATLGLKDTVEDVLITLGAQYHLIRPVQHKQGLFLYFVLDKTKGNLAMARFKLMNIEKDITGQIYFSDSLKPVIKNTKSPLHIKVQRAFYTTRLYTQR